MESGDTDEYTESLIAFLEEKLIEYNSKGIQARIETLIQELKDIRGT